MTYNVDVPVEPATTAKNLVYDSLSLNQQSFHHASAPSEPMDHPENTLHTPFINTTRKTAWYLRQLTEVHSGEAVSFDLTTDLPDGEEIRPHLNGEVLFRVSLLSEIKPKEYSMTVNGVVLEDHHTAKMVEVGPGRWDLTSFFNTSGFFIDRFGSLDVMIFKSSPSVRIMCHTAHISPEAVRTFENRAVFSYPVTKRYKTHLIEGAIPVTSEKSGSGASISSPISSLEFTPLNGKVSTQVLIEGEVLFDLPVSLTAQFGTSLHLWDLSVDSDTFTSPENVLSTPGLPLRHSIYLEGVEDEVYITTTAQLEVRGFKNPGETLGILMT